MQLFRSKPITGRRQLSLARSAIAKQAIGGDESESIVGSPSNVRVASVAVPEQEVSYLLDYIHIARYLFRF